MEASQRVWVVRGARDDEIARQVPTMQAVAISFRNAIDLAKMPTRAAVLEQLQNVISEKANPNVAGQLFRFAHEIEVGDIILTPEKGTRLVHVSRCSGQYRLDPSVFRDRYPHVVPVDYLTSIEWSSFPSDVRRKIGIPPTVFRADAAWPHVREMIGTTTGS